MTDPLLTIDDATREFRASPKTIRRRLVAGEIEGAYKRPGNRGPEWVMPRGSLEAAGFIRRNGVPAVDVPADPEGQAGYWEQRAHDAEAALEVARQGSTEPDSSRRRGGAWVGVAAAVIVGLVAVLLIAGRGDDPSPTDGLDPSHLASRSALAQATGTDEAIGVVGRVPVTLLPDERRYVLVDLDAEVPSAPRYLVAVVADDPPSSWVDVRAASDVVASVPVPEGVVELLDRGTSDPLVADGDDPAADDDVAGDEQAGNEEAAPDTASDPGPVDLEPAPTEEPSTPASVPSAPEADPTTPAGPGTVEVGAGDSFWTLAVALADGGDDSPTTAEVTAVWASLIDANLDRLVEPGNPDLLHIGQVLVVPSGR